MAAKKTTAKRNAVKAKKDPVVDLSAQIAKLEKQLEAARKKAVDQTQPQRSAGA